MQEEIHSLAFLAEEEAAGGAGCSVLAPGVVVVMFYVVLSGNGDQMPAWLEKLIAPLQGSALLRPDGFQHSSSQALIGNRWDLQGQLRAGQLRRAVPGEHSRGQRCPAD